MLKGMEKRWSVKRIQREEEDRSREADAGG
jgi:hypothetical protein